MLKSLFISFLSITICLSSFGQTTWTVTAGGTPDDDTVDPYFSPQELTIEQGDIVIWENIEGWHNVTTTSGPEDFSYGPDGSGWTHQHTFNMTGEYDYECSVGSHAVTQFGSITVVLPNGIEEESSAFEFTVSPNPVSDKLSIMFYNSSNKVKFTRLVNISGSTVWKNEIINSEIINVDVQKFPAGIYFLILTTDNTQFSRKIVIQ